MSGSSNLHQEKTDFMNRWSENMPKYWLEKFSQFDIHQGDLANSLIANPIQYNGNNSYRFSFDFLEYGRYVNVGTGREFHRGSGYQGDSAPLRKPKPWFSRVWYRSKFALRDYLSSKTAFEFKLIFDNLIN